VSDPVFKKTEITGTSTVSTDDAIQNAISRAQKTIRNVHWFEVVETTGKIQDGKVTQWQVTLKVGFALDD
jgi:flavin-binding protein dodecin